MTSTFMLVVGQLIFCHFICIFTRWQIEEAQPKSVDRGRLKWGNIGLNSQSPPRKWKSMLDVTGGKLTESVVTSPAKLLQPKTPPAVGASGRIYSNRRTISSSPLRYGIGI